MKRWDKLGNRLFFSHINGSCEAEIMFKKFLGLNLVWLAIMVALTFLYFETPYVELIEDVSPWYLKLSILFGPYLLPLEVIHWFLLKKIFPDKKKQNIITIITMLIAYAVAIFIVFIIWIRLTFIAPT
jgi:hypothetical protein